MNINNACEKIFDRLERINPAPKTGLIYYTDFQLLIAVMLSAQSTDKSVNSATKILFSDYGTPELMLSIGILKMENLIKKVGLYHTKARNILKTCDLIVNEFGGKVPNTREELESLPGVGRKTSNVVLNIAFNQPTIAVDTHVFRVSNRTGIAKGKNPLDVEKELVKNVPEKYLHNAHHLLILFGRYICIKRKPKCNQCIIKDLCEYYNNI
ncbi:endonuclease III [Candidatus Kinetoplastidibacterium galati]|uniref:Endonuclease III n=1 Tax=Candidatus Kinetoplastidibacterium galati TCC219 TaxID=1208921 RepID=M1LYN3_9PROT|nr:endonuclease III [Candidatus Kinetoplastibacterium galatii]AGF49181.1 endonuclease III [Candidatus Kinetoplastibacterium galatii TCC219]